MASALVMDMRFNPTGQNKHPEFHMVPLSYGEDWRAKIMPCLNGPFRHETEVIFVDFSLPTKELQELALLVKSIWIIDHHKTAEKYLQDFNMSNVLINFDMNESGASLAWKCCFPNKRTPKLIEYIADRDLWRFKIAASEEINSYIQSFDMNLKNYYILYSRLEDWFSDCLAEGIGICRYKARTVKSMCENPRIMNIQGYLVPVVNASTLFSEVGHELCQKRLSVLNDNLPAFAAYYFDRGDGIRQWGARSLDDFDVSVIAKALGGGGHKNAAGWQHPIERSE